MILNWDATR